MPQPDEREMERTLNLFPGSHHQVLNNADFRVAGRDIFTPTIAPTINVNVTASSPAGDWTRTSGLAQGSMDPSPETFSQRRHHGPPPPRLAISLPARKFSDHSRRPSDHNPRRDPPPPSSSSASASSSPRPSHRPRPMSDPPPEKVRDPRRLSGMLVSLRRLIHPKTPSSPEPQSSPQGIQSRRTAQDDPGSKYGSPTFKSLHRHASWDSSFSVESRDSDFTVSSIDEPEGWSRDPPKITTPEVYVSRMLKTGKGLACWQPRPHRPLAGENGTVPGDVGTFTAEGGFKKIFNLWEDNLLARKVAEMHKDEQPPFQLPQRNVFVAQNRIAKGDTVVQGTTGKAVYGDDDKTIRCFEFQCRAQEGALLAITSPADLEELEDHTALREYIFRHAELIYRHSNSIRRLDDPLYIITGCIKSETWALAAFSDPTTSTSDVLELVNLRTSTGEDRFVWTDRATAEACVGRSERAGHKDQTLFLRGFKLAFSPQFLHRMRTDLRLRSLEEAAQDLSLAPQGQLGHGPHVVGDSNRNVCDPNGTYISDLSTDVSDYDDEESDPPAPIRQPDNYASEYSPREVRVVPMAPQSGRYSCHPCDIINKYILDNTEADFALSHDDDWSFLLEDPLWSDLLCSELDGAPGDLISIRQGVAFISDAGTEDERKGLQEDEGSIYPPQNLQRSRGGSVHESSEHSDPGPTSIQRSQSSPQERQLTLSAPPLTNLRVDAPMKRMLIPPKPALSAWRLFLQDFVRTRELQGLPKVNAAQTVKKAAQEYRSLPDEDRKSYERCSEVARCNYNIELESYVRSLLAGGPGQENHLQTAQRKAGRAGRVGRDDTAAPKKPLSAYFQFLTHIRSDPHLVEVIFGDEAEPTKQSVLAAAKWRSMSDEDRKPFLTRAAEERAKYHEACLKYAEEGSPSLHLNSGRVDSQISSQEEKLRLKLGIQPGKPISLWSLPEPERGQRPPHPYSLLVQLAIYGRPSQRMTLDQIYRAIEDRFEYYRSRPEGSWKAEIRHSLSLNQVLRDSENLGLLGGSKEGIQRRCSSSARPRNSRPPMRHYSPTFTPDDSPWGPPSPESSNSDPYQSAPSSPVDVVSVWSTPNDSQTSLRLQ